MTLTDAVDAAYPFDLSVLPTSVRVVVGYLGPPGGTPHVWTREEVAAVEATGRAWWGVQVAPLRALTAADGAAAAQAAAARLAELGRAHRPDPVFYDVEYATWIADPAGARAAIAAFKSALPQAAARLRPEAYEPAVGGTDWIARWDNTRPDTLPAGVVGVQYGAPSGGAYDLDVFDPSLLGGTMLDQTDIAAIKTMLDQQFLPEVATVLRQQLGQPAGGAAPNLGTIVALLTGEQVAVVKLQTALDADDGRIEAAVAKVMNMETGRVPDANEVALVKGVLTELGKEASAAGQAAPAQ